jgi:DNA-binding NtrC family response regulator
MPNPILIVETTASAEATAESISVNRTLGQHLPAPIPPIQSIKYSGTLSPADPAIVVSIGSWQDGWCSKFQSLKSHFRRAFHIGILTGETDVSSCIAASNLEGLEDFLCGPVRPSDLVPRVVRLLRQAGRSTALDETTFRLPSVVGDSELLRSAMRKVPCIAASDACCLLVGETGTGKELFARAIHYNSPRKGEPFVPLNCAALPDHLFENELFGHSRGAYTDASSPEGGLLALAERGTLFLDEVDSLSHAAQSKLLRFLQDRQYRPLGSSRMLTANLRVIAATNSDLLERVRAKLFRQDLYHRIHVLYLSIPALRDRCEDVGPLSRHFLSTFAKQYSKNGMSLQACALQKLQRYIWPGNVRELENVIQRSVILARSLHLSAADIDLPDSVEGTPVEGQRLKQAKTEAVHHFERAYLLGLLAEHGGNITHAARAAGKERRSFQRLISKHQIERKQFT